MYCDKCGKELKSILVDEFQRDGSDSFISHPVKDELYDAAVVEIDSNWTGYDLSEEELLDTIICPHCGQFPFKNKEIQVYDIVRLVMFHSSGCEFCNGCSYTEESFSVTTQMGRTVETPFNFCPNCGRAMRKEWPE